MDSSPSGSATNSVKKKPPGTLPKPGMGRRCIYIHAKKKKKRVETKRDYDYVVLCINIMQKYTE